MLLLLPLAALAHIPHDPINAVAAPTDLSGSNPWWVVGFVGGQTELAVSYNQGTTWSKSNAAPTTAVDYVDDLAYDDTGLLVAASWNTYLYSTDGGATWSDVLDAPAKIEDLAGGDAMWMATRYGVWRMSDPAAGPELSLEGDFAEVAASGKNAAAIDANGGVWSFVDGVWTQRPLPIGELATAMNGDATFVGTFSGKLYQWADEGWTQCGSLPGEGEEHGIVLQISWDGSVLAVSTGLGGPYLALDECAEWSDRSIPLKPAYGMRGGTHDHEDAYTALVVSDARWISGGWAGLYISANAGVLWRESMWFLSPKFTLNMPENGDDGATAAESDRSIGLGAAEPDLAGEPEDAETPARGCFGAAGSALLVAPTLLALRRRRR